MSTQARVRELLSGAEAGFRPITDESERLLAAVLYELLAEGQPVETGRVAEVVGRPEPEVVAALAARPLATLVYRDDTARVVGFGGLGVPALGESRHRLRFDGRELYAWCAEDALFLPIVLDRTLQVESRCATTEAPITLTASPAGVAELEPRSATMSFLDPAEFQARGARDWGGDVIRNGCHFIHFFSTSAAAREWIAKHPGTIEMKIDEGVEFGQRWVEYAFGVKAQV